MFDNKVLNYLKCKHWDIYEFQTVVFGAPKGQGKKPHGLLWGGCNPTLRGNHSGSPDLNIVIFTELHLETVSTTGGKRLKDLILQCYKSSFRLPIFYYKSDKIYKITSLFERRREGRKEGGRERETEI